MSVDFDGDEETLFSVTDSASFIVVTMPEVLVLNGHNDDREVNVALLDGSVFVLVGLVVVEDFLVVTFGKVSLAGGAVVKLLDIVF